MNDYNSFPNEDIVNRFHYILSNEPSLQTRVIGGITKPTTFIKDQDIGDLVVLEIALERPLICIKLGSRVDGKSTSNSNNLLIKGLIVVDSSITESTQQLAELASSRLYTNIYQVLFNASHFGNLIISGWTGFQLNSMKSGELYEVSWRTFYAVNTTT